MTVPRRRACTVAVLVLLLQTGLLRIGHFTRPQRGQRPDEHGPAPAADVTISLLTPKKHYQKVSGLAFAVQLLVSMLTPAWPPHCDSVGLPSVILFDCLLPLPRRFRPCLRPAAAAVDGEGIVWQSPKGAFGISARTGNPPSDAVLAGINLSRFSITTLPCPP